jgi:hypothetical protein
MLYNLPQILEITKIKFVRSHLPDQHNQREKK